MGACYDCKKQKPLLIIYYHGAQSQGREFNKYSKEVQGPDNEKIKIEIDAGKRFEDLKAINDNVYYPHQPLYALNPIYSTDNLEKMILLLKDHNRIVLVATSLGGYFCTYMSEKYNLKCVLINPRIILDNDDELIQKYQESKFEGKNFYDNAWVKCPPKPIAWSQYQSIRCNQIKHPENFLVFVQMGDNMCNPKTQALEYFKDTTVKIYQEEGGEHIYLGFKSKLGIIKTFFYDGYNEPVTQDEIISPIKEPMNQN